MLFQFLWDDSFLLESGNFWGNTDDVAFEAKELD